MAAPEPEASTGAAPGPDLEVSQSRMGGQLGLVPEPVFMSEATKRVLGPLASSLRARLTRLVRMKSLDDIAGQLRQAGAPFDIQTYRRSNLFWVLVVPVFLAIPGIILRSTILAVVLFLAGALTWVTSDGRPPAVFATQAGGPATERPAHGGRHGRR